MHSSRAAVVTGVQGGQQVDHLGAPDLADHDSVRSHAQGLTDQVAHGDRTDALDVRGSGDQAHHMGMWRRELGGVFDADDPLGRIHCGQ